MCTVTIIPKGNNDFILTSNRDEAPNRISLAPEFYTVDGTEILFPKDELSGGTWIGVSEKKRVVCVLNGAFENHERKLPYRLSRGVVAKHFMVAEDVTGRLLSYDYKGIEPFTIVVADWNANLKFYELVWDGTDTHFSRLPLEAKIWSSSTLYNVPVRSERKQWFDNFRSNSEPNGATVLNFHKTAGKENPDYGVIMDRGFVKTTSITQIKKQADVVEMYYENLLKGQQSSKTFKFPQAVNG